LKDRKRLAKRLLGQIAQTIPQDGETSALDQARLLLSKLFDQQRWLVEDTSPYKVALCPRRAGKSYALLIYALYVALTVQNAQILIVARVRKQVKKSFWNPLRQLNREFGLGIHFRNNELEAELPNGSFIYLCGADTHEEIEKFRGTGYNLVVVDECKSFPNSLLQELLTEVIEPSLLDTGGSVVMIGTPGPVLSGAFYAVTTEDLSVIPAGERTHWTAKPYKSEESVNIGTESRPIWVKPKWSQHRWSLADNVGNPKIWERALARHKEKGVPDDDPTWRREYLAQWVPNGSRLVYSYGRIEDDRCLWVKDPKGPHGLPQGHSWRYVLGVDLGHDDATAFVVGAWSETNQALHYVHVEKHPKYNVGEIAARCRALEEQFGHFDARVIDTGGLGKMIAVSLEQIYGISFIPAEKPQKAAFIRLLNSDQEQGRIKIDPCSDLAEEYRVLTWKDETHRLIDPNCREDCSDAALYVWRFCYHHYWQDSERDPDFQSPAWWRAKEVEAEAAYRDRLIQERELPWWKAPIKSRDQSPVRFQGSIIYKA
jgi:hypothetical protein